ncbi:phosphoribosylformylglycinamidine synthase subunit PurL [Hugenholtzia roseola]|uniref:phosphoribosylformylglycinamidine synthase subunit PurL n=1 Tax=Hugenholtzia roseola TaxID=1002 RepID=UPI0003F4D672|nr:phosphoribosylformylglycinamidine synthase subunit PurL [Hugenholtzia roseola]
MEALTTVETAQKLGLTPEEFTRINEILGRVPNFTELSIFSVMWSEHCSYKNSIVWLKTLPKSSPRLLVEAGQENAGLVDIGDGLACSFKIESHNHPSALEPYQGAATGVGGINRDIFTMGARPIAGLNSLRFGNLQSPKTQWLLRGVVKGIGDYGNAFGIPTVGGEVYFDDCYNVNPLVNAFSAGIVETDKIASAIAYGVGNPVYIVGSATGKDGIHGATFASEDITAASAEKLPAVQVGDPFQEKLLLEATLEAIATGHIVGIQDMGAAGITCSTSEMSAKGEHGMVIDLDQVPCRQENMQPFEILLSESQERMLIVIKKGKEGEIERIFEKWDLNCAKIGEVTDTQRLHFYAKGELVADVPAHDLVLGGGAPVYHREYEEPPYYAQNQQFDPNTVEEPQEFAEYIDIFRFLLSHPNIASKRWISEQYDSMVGTANCSTNAPSDASVVHVKGTNKNIVITVDCNARYVHADPEKGCAIAVAEAARNIVCTGGQPIAITNCLNFGNPYNKHVYWQFVGAIKGMGAACRKFNTPVTGGNVSFYNQSSDEGPVFPTPTIGMLGLMEGLEKRVTLDFKKAGDLIYLVGVPKNDLASSEYLYSYCGVKNSPAPAFDLDEEYAFQQNLAALIGEKLLASAHDISDGGLLIAVAESALAGRKGFDLKVDLKSSPLRGLRFDAFLFGENQSRAIVSVNTAQKAAFEAKATALGIAFLAVGEVGEQKEWRLQNQLLLTLEEGEALYEGTLPKYLNV